jgi:uncharacterized protein (DUF433 family)
LTRKVTLRSAPTSGERTAAACAHMLTAPQSAIRQVFIVAVYIRVRDAALRESSPRGSVLEYRRMSDWQPSAYEDYRWIVADPQLLGGKLAIRGRRLSVSLILECLAGGMTLQDIDESFAHGFPHEALPEVLRVASELTDSFHVAA